MINLFDEIIKLTGLPADMVFARYRYVVLGGKTCYVEQHNGIYSLSDNEIILNLKNEKIQFLGDNLKIKYLSKGDLILSGDIREIKHLS